MQVSGILGCDVDDLKMRNGREEKWSDTSESLYYWNPAEEGSGEWGFHSRF